MTLRDLKAFEIAACDNGGYLIRSAFLDKGDQRVIAAFTSATDLLAWLAAEMIGSAKRETVKKQIVDPRILAFRQRRAVERAAMEIPRREAPVEPPSAGGDNEGR